MRHLPLFTVVLLIAAGLCRGQLSTVTSGTVLEGSASTQAPAAAAGVTIPGGGTTGVAWDTRMETVNLPGVAARRALEWLSAASGVTILVDWTAMQAQGVDPQTPVNLELHAVTFKQVLELLMQQMQSPSTAYESQLVYEEDGTFLQLLTKGQANQRLVVRTYDIADVSMPVPSFNHAPQMDLASVLEGGGTEGGGVSFEEQDAQEATPSQADRGELVAQMVREMVEPRVWQQNGGPASVRFFNGRLVVNAPMYVQRQIDRALPGPAIGDPNVARYVGYSGGAVFVNAPTFRAAAAPPPAATPVSPAAGTRLRGNIGAVDRTPARPIVGRER